MTDTMRSVADFVLGMIGQCSNLDELLAVERNPSFMNRLMTLQEHDAALFEETFEALNTKRAEFGNTVKLEQLGMERMGIRGPG